MLKARRKYTKRELKQDKFVLATFQAKSFIEENARIITYAALGVIALIVIIYLYMDSRQSAQIKAADLLSKAQATLQSGDRQGALTMFSEVVDQYGGTDAAGHAAFYLARQYWESDDVEQARNYFKTFLDDYAGKNIITQAAYAGFADCLSMDKNFGEAAQNYLKAARLEPDFPQAATYLYSAAESFVAAGEPGKAREILKEIIKTEKEPLLKNRAQVLLAGLSD